MALVRKPDLKCPNCRKDQCLSFYDDGSIRSSVHDGKCSNRPPGPPDYPKLEEKGRWVLRDGEIVRKQ